MISRLKSRSGPHHRFGIPNRRRPEEVGVPRNCACGLPRGRFQFTAMAAWQLLLGFPTTFTGQLLLNIDRQVADERVVG